MSDHERHKAEAELAGIRKAAMLLVVLARNQRPLFGNSLRKGCSQEVAGITAISAEQVSRSKSSTSVHRRRLRGPGRRRLLALLLRAFDPEHAQRLLDRLTKAMRPTPFLSTQSRPTRSRQDYP